MRKIVTFCLIVLTLASCQEKIVIEGTPENVFEVFWNTLNERYVHFPDKDIDWDAVYHEYMPRFREAKTEGDLRELFGEIIDMLRDTHLYIKPNHCKVGPCRLISFIPDYPLTIFESNIERYGFERIADISPFRIYQHNSKGYVYISCYSFKIDYSAEWLLTTINGLNYSEGVIVDVSRNGGGNHTYYHLLSSLFVESGGTFYYRRFRNGIEHDSYTEPQKESVYQYRDLPQDWLCFSKVPVVLITSRFNVSASTVFAYIVGELPNVLSIGHPSLGDGDRSRSVWLPNGWSMSYPFGKLFSRNGLDMHKPFVPDVELEWVATRDTTAVIRALEHLDSLNAYQWTNYWEIPSGGKKSYYK